MPVRVVLAPATGDVIHLRVPRPGSAAGLSTSSSAEAAIGTSAAEEAHSAMQGERYALDVVALRGLPGTRCGLPEGARPTLDVAAAIRYANPRPPLRPHLRLRPLHALNLRYGCTRLRTGRHTHPSHRHRPSRAPRLVPPSRSPHAPHMHTHRHTPALRTSVL